VRIIDSGSGMRLPDKPLPERLASGQSRRQDLQSNLPAQPLNGTEHHRHAALANLLIQQVTSNHSADSQAVHVAKLFTNSGETAFTAADESSLTCLPHSSGHRFGRPHHKDEDSQPW
jgi:hypothetical protein